MRTLVCIVFAALVAFYFVSVARSLADYGAKQIDQLHRVDIATALDVANVAPWHMKMAVQVFDAKGQVAEQGLIEEWWAGPGMDRVVYAVPSYKATELQNGAGFFRSKGAEQPPWMLELLREQVVHPMPAEREYAGTKPELRKEKFGKATFACVMLSRVNKDVGVLPYLPTGTFPTYCMDASGALRATYDYGAQMILRNDVGEFAGRAVAKDIAIGRGGVAAVSGRVFKLEGLAADAAADQKLFAESGELERVGLELSSQRPVQVGAATVAGTLLSKVNPVYPEAAKARHAAGAVVVQAVIGRDGRVRFVRLVSSPDAELGEAAMGAVRQWVYKPFVVDGEAVEVETAMILNFTGG